MHGGESVSYALVFGLVTGTLTGLLLPRLAARRPALPSGLSRHPGS